MRQIFAFVLIIISSSLFLAHQQKSEKELLQWLSSLPRYGIEVSADHQQFPISIRLKPYSFK